MVTNLGNPATRRFKGRPCRVKPPAPSAPLLPPVGTRPESRLLGQILIEMGAIGPDGLAEALSIQHLDDERVGEALVRIKACSDWDICRALARQFGLPALQSIDAEEIDDRLVETLPISYARANTAIPHRIEGDVLRVLAADPLKLPDLDDLGALHDAVVSVTLMPSSAIGELSHPVRMGEGVRR